MTSHGLICPYIDNDPKFAYGVEFGMLFVRMRGDEELIEGCFLRANQDQILLACNWLGWRAVKMKPHDEDWMWFRLEKVGAEK